MAQSTKHPLGGVVVTPQIQTQKSAIKFNSISAKT